MVLFLTLDLEYDLIRKATKLVDIILLLAYYSVAHTKVDHSQSCPRGHESIRLFIVSTFIRGRIEYGRLNVEPEAQDEALQADEVLLLQTFHGQRGTRWKRTV